MNVAEYCRCISGYIVDPTLIIDKKSGDSRLAIGIGIAASLVVIFLVLTLVYFLRCVEYLCLYGHIFQRDVFHFSRVRALLY